MMDFTEFEEEFNEDEELKEVTFCDEDEEPTYYEELSMRGLKVDELIEILEKDGELTDDRIIQIGAASSWLWIGKYKDYKSDFIPQSEEDFQKAKEENKRLDKAVKEILKRTPTPLSRECKLKEVSEYARACKNFGIKLEQTMDEKTAAVRTVKKGPFHKRRIIEVYPSIQTGCNSIMIRIIGDERGEYWDISEMPVKR